MVIWWYFSLLNKCLHLISLRSCFLHPRTTCTELPSNISTMRLKYSRFHFMRHLGVRNGGFLLYFGAFCINKKAVNLSDSDWTHSGRIKKTIQIKWNRKKIIKSKFLNQKKEKKKSANLNSSLVGLKGFGKTYFILIWSFQ